MSPSRERTTPNNYASPRLNIKKTRRRVQAIPNRAAQSVREAENKLFFYIYIIIICLFFFFLWWHSANFKERSFQFVWSASCGASAGLSSAAHGAGALEAEVCAQSEQVSSPGARVGDCRSASCLLDFESVAHSALSFCLSCPPSLLSPLLSCYGNHINHGCMHDGDVLMERWLFTLLHVSG